MRDGQQDVTGLSKTTTAQIISVGDIYIFADYLPHLRVEHVNKIHWSSLIHSKRPIALSFFVCLPGY